MREALWWAGLVLVAACGDAVIGGDAGGDDAAAEAESVARSDGEADDAVTVADAVAETVADAVAEAVAVADAVAETAAVADAEAETVADAVAETVADAEAETVADTEAETVADAAPGPSPAPNDCVTSVEAGHHLFSCFGFDFDVEIPPQCTGGGCGLVVDVHGFTMSAQMQDDNTDMRALGKQYGYVVVQPTAKGLPPAWSNTGGDDDDVWEFVQRAIEALAIDEKRLHFTGFSQGGFMTWRFLCEHADALASVAPAAGCSWSGATACAFSAGQMPSQPIPVLYMHGRKDGIVSWACAELQHEAVVDGWDLKQTQVISKDGDHEWTRFEGPNGAVYELVAHDYLAKSLLITGHCYPGSGDQNGGAPGQIVGFGCQPPNAFTWGEIAMEFFMAHPRP